MIRGPLLCPTFSQLIKYEYCLHTFGKGGGEATELKVLGIYPAFFIGILLNNQNSVGPLLTKNVQIVLTLYEMDEYRKPQQGT